MYKITLKIFFTLIVLIGCNLKKEPPRNHKAPIKFKSDFLDSLKQFCEINTITDFEIKKIQTDNFDGMFPVSKEFYLKMYSDEKDYQDNSFFIHSYIPNESNFLTAIIYQKNYEGEDYRVDYLDLVNMDSTGKVFNKFRLAAEDNSTITYEVESHLSNDTLNIIEKVSSESYENPSHDTLYTNHISLKLNNQNGIDTIDFKQKKEVRLW